MIDFVCKKTPLYMYFNTSYDDGDEEEEGNCTQVCRQVQEATASWKKRVFLLSRTRCVIYQIIWMAEFKTTRCVLDISREDRTAARYEKHKPMKTGESFIKRVRIRFYFILLTWNILIDFQKLTIVKMNQIHKCFICLQQFNTEFSNSNNFSPINVN